MSSILKMNIQYKIEQLRLVKLIRLFCLLSIFLGIGFQANATHIVGGEMTYRCLGNNRYEIILTVYRDCFYGDPLAHFDDPAWLGFYRASNNTPVVSIGINGVLNVPYNASDTLDGQITSECNVVGMDICVHRAVYRTIVTLPAITGGYNIVYQRCCRNETLQNIVSPLNTGAVFSVHITGKALTECNSSPMIDEWPPIYICANKPISYDHSATDADGDLILYTLCNPYASGDTADGRVYPPPPPPFDTVVWSPGYSLNNLLGGTDPLKIDINTGLITGTPPTVGQFLVGICVDEFRDGVLLSRIRRDFQYNVRECINPTNACFKLPDTLCNTTVVPFVNCSQGSISYQWTFYDKDGNVSSTSTEFEPVVTYPEYGSYRVRLIAMEDANCIDTADQVITIGPTAIEADFTLSVPDCSDTITIKTTNNSTGAANYQWFLVYSGSTIAQSNEAAPAFTVTEEGLYVAVLIASHQNGCSDTLQRSITVRNLSDEIVPDSYNICLGESVSLNPNGNQNLQYIWTPSTFLSPNNVVPNPTSTPTSDITYFVTILDPVNGCSYDDTVRVTLGADANLAFGFTNDCGVLKVDFINNTTPPQSYFWDFGDGIGTSTEANPSYTYPQPGTYTVKLSNVDGCKDTISQEVSVNFIDIDAISDSIYLCGTDTVSLNPNGNPNYNYLWEPANKIIGSNTVPNPTAVIDGYTVFTVRVADLNFDECYVEGRVAVDLAKLDISSQSPFVCEGETTTIGISLTGGTGTPTIVWSPDTYIISGQGTQSIEVEGVENQVFTVQVSYDNGCTISGTSSLTVGTYGGTVSATIDADTIYDAETVRLHAFPSGLSYSWTPAEGLDNASSQDPTFTPTQPGDYIFTVQVTQADGCSQTATVRLHVRETLCDGEHVFLPNAFSPNGDGRNDVLQLYQNNVVDKLNTLIIYNRMGQEIFKTSDLDFAWDGTFNGKPLDPDVYGFYLDVLCIDGAQFILRGNITIVK